MKQKRYFIFGPLYYKELIQIAWSRRSLWIRVLVLAVMLGITWLMARDLDDEEGLIGLAITLLTAAAVLAPAVTADCIAGEVEARTLPLLFLTRMTTGRIARDKGFARLTYLTLLVGLGFPFLFALILLGKVEWWQILGCVCYIVGALLIGGATGMLFSTIRKTVLSALISSYLYLGIAIVAATVVAAVIGMTFGRHEQYGALFHPWFGIPLLVESHLPWESQGSCMRYSGSWTHALGWIPFVVLAVVYARTILWIVSRKLKASALREEARDDEPDEGERKPSLYQRLKRVRFKIASADCVPGWRRKTTRSYLWWYGGLILLLGTTEAVTSEKLFRESDYFVVWYFILIPVILLYTLVRFGNLFAQERAKDRLDLILTTPIPGRALFSTSLLRTCRDLLPFWLMPIFMILIAAFVGSGAYSRGHISVAQAVGSLVTVYLTTVAVASIASCLLRSPMRAIFVAAIILTILLGAPFLADIDHHGSERNLSPLYWAFVAATTDRIHGVCFVGMRCYLFPDIVACVVMARGFDLFLKRQGD